MGHLSGLSSPLFDHISSNGSCLDIPKP